MIVNCVDMTVSVSRNFTSVMSDYNHAVSVTLTHWVLTNQPTDRQQTKGNTETI